MMRFKDLSFNSLTHIDLGNTTPTTLFVIHSSSFIPLREMDMNGMNGMKMMFDEIVNE